jgi:hypothetical protein
VTDVVDVGTFGSLANWLLDCYYFAYRYQHGNNTSGERIPLYSCVNGHIQSWVARNWRFRRNIHDYPEFLYDDDEGVDLTNPYNPTG